MVGARKKGTRARPNSCNRRHATGRNYARPAADIGRRSWPMSTLPQLERLGHDRVHFVAVAQ
jgi:hypothetical protein